MREWQAKGAQVSRVHPRQQGLAFFAGAWEQRFSPMCRAVIRRNIKDLIRSVKVMSMLHGRQNRPGVMRERKVREHS